MVEAKRRPNSLPVAPHSECNVSDDFTTATTFGQCGVVFRALNMKQSKYLAYVYSYKNNLMDT